MQSNKPGVIRVVVIDDSSTARDLLVGLFQEAGDILVAGVGGNGEDALRLVKRLHPDLVTMDVRMPKMDGLEATRQVMRECPTPIVILSASMKCPDLDLTFQALQAGALTVINKPGMDDPETCEQVLQVVRTMAEVPVIHHWGRKGSSKPAMDAGAGSLVIKESAQRPVNQALPELSEIGIVGIAASTGGPSALAAVLEGLPSDFSLPILVVQHVSPGFATGLADWLANQTQLRVDLAAHGDVLQPGTLTLAPDDYHMQINERGVIELSKAAPYKGLRPSANFLFDSLARVFGPHALGIMLTGMGDDGADGLEALHRAGGLTIAQDEESCVVYGMPREAVLRNAVDRVYSLEQIRKVLEHLPRNTRLTTIEDQSTSETV